MNCTEKDTCEFAKWCDTICTKAAYRLSRFADIYGDTDLGSKK